MKRHLILLIMTLVFCLFSATALAAEPTDGAAMNMYENSDFIEKEQPELTEETKALISLYKRQPTTENYLQLRAVVIKNYDAVLVRKEAKLAELKAETAGKPRGDELVAEMEEIVQGMYITYWNRINSSMLRFTDPRLLNWKIAAATQYEYIPVMGAGESIYVKRTPVTNAEYAAFVLATGAQAPANWADGTYPATQADHPVTFVSYQDAQAYCNWLSANDSVNTYRLPNESEWELAAGHMPKDADFNCGVNNGTTSVERYAKATRGAHGAVDFWGNVWEWTSTVRAGSDGNLTLGVKGGCWSSARTDCRTENRQEGRDAANGYADVGFRVIRVLNGAEPAQKVELATLTAPMVTATALSSTAIELNWQPVEEAVEYQIFTYAEQSGLVSMLQCTAETCFTVEGLRPGTSYGYIVQPISYVEIADNVSAAYAVTATTLGQPQTTFVPTTFAFASIKAETSTGSQVTVRLTGSSDVAAVAVNGEAAVKIFSGSKKDVATWKAVLNPTKAGSYAVKAIAYDETGFGSEPITSSVAVSPRGNTASTRTSSLDAYEYNGMSYLLYTPANATENMPLIVYLHGYESKGDDPTSLVETDSFCQYLSEGQFGSVAAYVLTPQLSTAQRGWIGLKDQLMDLVNAVADSYAIDRDNISLTGFSIGGSGVWSIGAGYSDSFARIAPCAGTISLNKRTLTNLSSLDIWAFIGSADTAMDPQDTRDCAAALLEKGAAIKVSEFDGATHTQVPQLAYLDTELLAWLIGRE